MRLIKKLNNNFALALDERGCRVVAAGKGLGFGRLPRNVTAADEVAEVYYGLPRQYIEFFSEIPEEIIEVCQKIMAYAQFHLDRKIQSNFLFLLADHTDFCIKRYQSGLSLDFSQTLDFRYQYRKELDVGFYALQVIEEDLGIALPGKEAYGFAIDLVNAEEGGNENDKKKEIDQLIAKTVQTIEEDLPLKVQTDSLSYERFELHLRYLFSRLQNEQDILEKQSALYEQICQEYADVCRCVEDIVQNLSASKGWSIGKSEQLYLILHINRLLEKEAS
jgi:beta-glucoside operon transcriptional antiterminator